LSLETILYESKTRWQWRFRPFRIWCFVSVSKDSTAFIFRVSQSKKKAL
jgi:hypothetical protein